MQSDIADRPQADWYGMREAAQSSPSAFRSLLEQYKSTTSPVIAGWLIGVITHCRRHGPVQPEEAIAALIELTKSLKVWALGQTPTGLLAALQSAIYENGLPDRTDHKALAEFIWQAAFQHYSTFKGPRHDLDVDVINLCASLARREQLIPVLTTRSGLRDEMILKLESMVQRLATEDKDLYRATAPMRILRSNHCGSATTATFANGPAVPISARQSASSNAPAAGGLLWLVTSGRG